MSDISWSADGSQLAISYCEDLQFDSSVAATSLGRGYIFDPADPTAPLACLQPHSHVSCLNYYPTTLLVQYSKIADRNGRVSI